MSISMCCSVLCAQPPLCDSQLYASVQPVLVLNVSDAQEPTATLTAPHSTWILQYLNPALSRSQPAPAGYRIRYLRTPPAKAKESKDIRIQRSTLVSLHAIRSTPIPDSFWLWFIAQLYMYTINPYLTVGHTAIAARLVSTFLLFISFSNSTSFSFICIFILTLWIHCLDASFLSYASDSRITCYIIRSIILNISL